MNKKLLRQKSRYRAYRSSDFREVLRFMREFTRQVLDYIRDTRAKEKTLPFRDTYVIVTNTLKDYKDVNYSGMQRVLNENVADYAECYIAFLEFQQKLLQFTVSWGKVLEEAENAYDKGLTN